MATTKRKQEAHVERQSDKANTAARGGVQLRDHHSAASILYEVLDATLAQYSAEFTGLAWPNTLKAFRQNYVTLLPELEAIRLASDRRYEIGQWMADQIQGKLMWQDGDEQQLLSEYLQTAAAPLPLTMVAGKATGGWRPEFNYLGQEWLKTDSVANPNPFAALGTCLAERNIISAGAQDALGWVGDHDFGADLNSEQGELLLGGRKIVVLGAAAEMAPTQFWLKSGADVLWIDRAMPPESLLSGEGFSGRLSYVPAPTDLLQQPAEILATMIEFANQEPMDLCLYAYAPGEAREIRLTGAMNSLVNALPEELIATITMLVSPTTPTQVSNEDVAASEKRLGTRPAWEALLDKLGLLGRDGGHSIRHDVAVSRTLVSIQGASYQAAQYLGKVITAEAWSRFGVGRQGESANGEPGLRVSATTAAITQTRSLDHPVFDAAFGGAAALQVETFTPVQSQCLNALLAIHDWLGPRQPVPGEIRVHGGIHTLPYPLEQALRPAAGIGFLKSPGLLLGLLGKRG